MTDTIAPPKHILICDDDPDIREFLSFALKRAGYSVDVSDGCTAALMAIEQRRPDLLLLDIWMPEEDGFFLAEKLRHAGIRIPTVFVTAHDNSFNRVYSASLEAKGYVTKPLDVDDLISRVGSILSPGESSGARSGISPILSI
jgi:two-component system OmpR family response regulator